MKQQFEVILTGSDMPVDGIVSPVTNDSSATAWEFVSLDGSLKLTIAKDEKGNWQRIAGTEPYLSSWIDELAEQVK